MGSSLALEILKGPLPAVKSADLKCVWSLLASEKASNASIGGFGISRRALAECCSPDCDVAAVFLRASLVDVLLQRGSLDAWRTGDGLWDGAFEFAAALPWNAALGRESEPPTIMSGPHG
jgi:hypothetical protein